MKEGKEEGEEEGEVKEDGEEKERLSPITYLHRLPPLPTKIPSDQSSRSTDNMQNLVRNSEYLGFRAGLAFLVSPSAD